MFMILASSMLLKINDFIKLILLIYFIALQNLELASPRILLRTLTLNITKPILLHLSVVLLQLT